MQFVYIKLLVNAVGYLCEVRYTLDIVIFHYEDQKYVIDVYNNCIVGLCILCIYLVLISL